MGLIISIYIIMGFLYAWRFFSTLENILDGNIKLNQRDQGIVEEFNEILESNLIKILCILFVTVFWVILVLYFLVGKLVGR